MHESAGVVGDTALSMAAAGRVRPLTPQGAAGRAFAAFASISADGSAEWLELGAPPPETSVWTRALAMPSPGQRRSVRLTRPPGAPDIAGAEIWLLFLPAPAEENGWEEHPETLAETAFVQCRLLEPEAWARRGEVWFAAKVLSVLPLADIETAFAPVKVEGLATWPWVRGTVTEFGAFTLLWAPQDDCGFWLAGLRRGASVHLLAGGEWVLDEHRAFAAHVELTALEWDLVARPPHKTK